MTSSSEVNDAEESKRRRREKIKNEFQESITNAERMGNCMKRKAEKLCDDRGNGNNRKRERKHERVRCECQ